MPTYEYLCAACKHEWEEVQKISEPPLEVCPSCGKKAAKRQISGGGFILKGGGWYADLYSSAKPGKKQSEASFTKAASEAPKSNAPAASPSAASAPAAAPASTTPKS